LVNTILGFFQALIVEAEGGFVVSGTPDKVGDSDLLAALKKIIHDTFGPAIQDILEIRPTLVPEAPNDGHLRGRKNKKWDEIVIPASLPLGDAIEALKYFSTKTIMITNAETVDRRLKRYDIGLPYLSEAAEVYHFDTDLKNQNQGSSITLGYTAPPVFVGITDSNGAIYLNPAVLDKPPYEPLGKSLLGEFSIITKAPSSNSTIEFWVRSAPARALCLLRVKTAMEEELVLVTGGPGMGYSTAAPGSIGYSAAAPGSIGYSTAAPTESRVEHNSPKGKESVPLSGVSIDPNSWIHIAAVTTETKLALFIGTSQFTFNKDFPAAADMDVKINEDKNEINLDELNIDRAAAISAAAFNQNTEFFIPYAALDYTQKWAVLMFDNPNRVATNLFESEQFKMAVLAAINNSK
jgi:hypothetical protein